MLISQVDVAIHRDYKSKKSEGRIQIFGKFCDLINHLLSNENCKNLMEGVLIIIIFISSGSRLIFKLQEFCNNYLTLFLS